MKKFQKLFKKYIDIVIEFVIKNRRYFGAGIIFALIMVLLFVFVSPKETKIDPMDTVTEEFNTAKNEELEKLITNYYKAYADGDIEKLEKIATPISEKEASYIQFYSQYLDYYKSPKIYTKPGYTEDSFICSVVVDLKFAGIETLAPGCDFFYVEKNESGKYFINNLYGSFNQYNGVYEMDSAVTALISSYISQEDFIELSSEVTKQYNTAVLSDENLSTLVNVTLHEEMAKWSQTYEEEVKAAEEAAAEAEKAAQEEAKAAEEAEQAEKEQAEKAEDVETKTGRITKNVNVRAEANTDCDRVGKLKGGEEVTVYGSKGDFYQIDFDGSKAYVAKEFITIDGEEGIEETSTKTSASVAEGSKITLETTVNIRSQMDSSSSKVAVAYAGDEITVVMSYAEGWTKVKLGKKEGYIRTDLLTK